MASLPPNSLLARARSNRAANGKPASSSSSSHATATAAPQTPALSPNVNTFLTNLRLLDLDSLPDWPGFDAHTFSLQKKRIQSIEWALYQLFVLWDPDEAHAKLNPYFPPRDQVSSVNLRSALLRLLEQAKKNGALGRDAVVRKTMLDECRGERLEEALAVFSSAVLKKLVAAASEAEGEHPAVAQQLALQDRGYAGDNVDLVVLALAHRASLSRNLRDKDHARRKYEDLAELLDLKERSMARRKEQIEAKNDGGDGGIAENTKHDVWRTVRNNWAGNEKWMEALLEGDARARQDGVLSAPFDRVWRRLQSDRLSELEDQGKGLLEQLDGRVKSQQASLQKWQDFQHRMFGARAAQAGGGNLRGRDKPKTRKRGIDLGFDSHDNLRAGRMSPRKQVAKAAPTLTPEYSALLEDFRRELDQAGAVSRPKNFKVARGLAVTRQPARPEMILPEESHDEPVTERSEPEEEAPIEPESVEPESVESETELEPVEHVAVPAPMTGGNQSRASEQSSQRETPSSSDARGPSLREVRNKLSSNRPMLSRNTSEYQEQPTASLSRHTSHSSVSASRPSRPQSRSPERKPQPPQPPAPVIAEPQGPPSPEPPSPRTEMADRILASMDSVSPSPVKQAKPRPTMSLAERTRLSMARMSRGGASGNFDANEATTPEEESPTAPLCPVAEDDTTLVGASDVPYQDLASRTRQSLAGFEASKQKAQLERRKSERKSRRARRDGSHFFPGVQEVDEPTGDDDSTMPTIDVDQSMLAEELMAEEDMEAVFKSRPKLQLSPRPSRHWGEGEGEEE